MATKTSIVSTADIIRVVQKTKHDSHSILLFLLSAQKNIISTHEFMSAHSSVLPSFSDIFIPAFYVGAKFIVLVANSEHSLNPQYLPSSKTLAYIKNLQEASEFLNIPLLDFISLSKDGYYSALENKIL